MNELNINACQSFENDFDPGFQNGPDAKARENGRAQAYSFVRRASLRSATQQVDRFQQPVALDRKD